MAKKYVMTNDYKENTKTADALIEQVLEEYGFSIVKTMKKDFTALKNWIYTNYDCDEKVAKLAALGLLNQY
jgi:hypothetical protein